MMRTFRLCLVSCAIVLGLGAAAQAQAPSGTCPPWRPCGIGPSWGGNRLIPQGAFGADFRPACYGHDRCLEAGGNPAACDRKFYEDMKCACNQSRHPALCRCKARMYYLIARIWHIFPTGGH
jgi:hypothetical protein